MKNDEELLKELYESAFAVLQVVIHFPDDGRINNLKQTLNEVKEELARKERRDQRLKDPPPVNKTTLNH